MLPVSVMRGRGRGGGGVVRYGTLSGAGGVRVWEGGGVGVGRGRHFEKKRAYVIHNGYCG